MINKVISNNSDVMFNELLQFTITDMDQQGYILANIDYKPVAVNNNIYYTALLTFANPREEQSKMTSALNIVSNGIQDLPFFR